MKITIVGPGAMGCLFAVLLTRSKSKNDVWLLDKYPERAKKIAASGIVVEGMNNFKQDVQITTDAKKIGPSELIIIYTKSYDTESVLASIKPLLSDNTIVLSLQNGLGNLELIADAVGEDKVMGGITAHGCTLLSRARIRHAGKGETIIARMDGRLLRDARNIANVLNEAGIDVKVSKDVKSLIWSKLVVSAGINALATICRLPNGALLSQEGIKDLMRQAVIEAAKVAKRKKVKLIYDDPLAKLESICEATSGNICSMLQDIMQNKRTEIDSINGAVLRQGKGCGVKTPINEILAQLIKAIESTYSKRVKL